VIGTVIASTPTSCRVRIATGSPPAVGVWLRAAGRDGILEDYRYGKDGTLQATVRMLKNATPWLAPLPPGTQVDVAPATAASGERQQIVAGYTEGRELAPFSLDAAYLLGPEGAHVNASGISGLATKTSFLMNLIADVMRRARRGELDATCFLVNVKHQDLMRLDRPAALSADDRAVYRAMGVEPEPFSQVRYYAPAGSLASRRSDVRSFGYSLETGFDLLGNLVGELPDANRTIAALVDVLVEGRRTMPAEFGVYDEWKSIWREPPLVPDGIMPASWLHFAQATTRRLVRHLQHVLEHQNTGLFVDSSARGLATIAEAVAGAQPGDTVVLDLSTMNATEQFFCMAELVRCIYADVQSTTRRLPKSVLLFVDELNRFGGRGRSAHPIRDLLLEVAERGRSIGVSLVSAQQFASHVHPRIFGNAATRVVGRLTSDELVRAEYRFLGATHKEWLRYMPKGELIVHHAPVGHPVKVRFPRPCFALGEA
jgi:hypothetical protein